ncbi:metallophosphoesterase [Carboxylicivirga mesophila]|uniref:Metallophosphoesterase n=1 Tax=Carboxylicivirga mesophila TaxID=1166478 RepID=A0ABS5KBE3_9BACT|nr:metallophosphoesterase [Carboxylicivirga mesophila]MBS2212269.1 metallophosphoesterase [Carboxylicivirga mesophila]
MKNYGFLIFISIILSIHFLVNYYIYHRGIQWLETMPAFKTAFRITMLILVIAYPAGRFLERIWYSPVSNTLHWIGAFWFAGMLYFTLLLFATDIIRMANYIIHFLPKVGTPAYLNLKLYTGITITAIGLLVILGGFINAWSPKISRHQLTINKTANGAKELKIVAASDIHLGTIIGPRKTRKLVETINSLKPDIILLAGDVVDEDVMPVIKQNLGESLKQLQAPMGVYASTGNHEYIGGAERSVKYLEEHGINVLRDTSVFINNQFYIIGREDRDKNRTAQARLEINELIAQLDQTKPLIMLDHQPYNLDLPTQSGIDLQISGHTHHGQLWPFGYITNRIFELSRGYLKKQDSHFIVSTGFGTWGPPVRTGNRPEILEINVNFK